jgi:diadenosine tetraphosphate (Ap4A) HIT family hydrolase
MKREQALGRCLSGRKVMFELHAQLARDCAVVGDLSLCRVLLMNDRRFPWLLLVPRRPDISEIFQLTALDQRLLWEEVGLVTAALAGDSRADKMNVATLGNVVQQLHIHVVARYQGDAAWPGPVWGCGSADPFAEEALAARGAALQELLAPLGLSGRGA